MKVFADNLLEGKVAIITGGGTGIGLATALEMASLGAKIAICSRKQEKMDAGKKALEEAGADFLAETCNIRERAEVETFVGKVVEHFGGVDILVNNAGGQFPSPAGAIQPKGWNAVIDTNLTGTWNVTQVVGQKSMFRRGGVIVNVILAAERPWPGVAHSGAARAAVDNLTRSLAVEWAQFGIRVVCLGPGTIATEGVQQYPKPLLDSILKRIPWGRAGTAEECAQMITFMASPAAAFLTGETVTMDGAQRYFTPDMPVRKIKEDDG